MKETRNPVRKHPRLPGYDYSTESVYFITICTKNRKRCLCSIVGRGLDPAVGVKIQLTEYGKIACMDLTAIPNHFPEITIEKFVIMPDHIHLLMRLGCGDDTAGSRPRPTVSTVIGQYKSGVSRKCGCSLWQTSYYDHVVRSQQDFEEIWQYIDNNPLKWLVEKQT